MAIQDHSGIKNQSLEDALSLPEIEKEGAEAEETTGGEQSGNETDSHQGEKSPPEKAQPSEEQKETEESDTETFEDLLTQNEQSVTYTKVQKYPESEEDDIVFDDKGKPVIKAQHLADDIDALFGEKPNPKLYFAIYKNTPRKAEQIAKASGWKSRHHMKASVEMLVAAKSQDERDRVLKDEFPEFTYSSDVESPFELDIEKERKGKTIESDVKNGKLPWKNDEIQTALDSIVSKNEKLDKESLLKNPKLAKSLVEVSVLRLDNGEVLPPEDALNLAIAKAGIEGKPEKVVPRMGNAKGERGLKKGQNVSPETIALAKALGRSDLIQ